MALLQWNNVTPNFSDSGQSMANAQRAFKNTGEIARGITDSYRKDAILDERIRKNKEAEIMAGKRMDIANEQLGLRVAADKRQAGVFDQNKTKFEQDNMKFAQKQTDQRVLSEAMTGVYTSPDAMAEVNTSYNQLLAKHAKAQKGVIGPELVKLKTVQAREEDDLSKRIFKFTEGGGLTKVYDADKYSKQVMQKVLDSGGSYEAAQKAQKDTKEAYTRKLTDIEKAEYKFSAGTLKDNFSKTMAALKASGTTIKNTTGGGKNGKTSKGTGELTGVEPTTNTSSTTKTLKALGIGNDALNFKGEKKDVAAIAAALRQNVGTEESPIYLDGTAQAEVLARAVKNNFLSDTQINMDALPGIMSSVAQSIGTQGHSDTSSKSTQTSTSRVTYTPRVAKLMTEAQNNYNRGMTDLNARFKRVDGKTAVKNALGLDKLLSKVEGISTEIPEEIDLNKVDGGLDKLMDTLVKPDALSVALSKKAENDKKPSLSLPELLSLMRSQTKAYFGVKPGIRTIKDRKGTKNRYGIDDMKMVAELPNVEIEKILPTLSEKQTAELIKRLGRNNK